MPRILAIDTSTDACSVAYLSESTLLEHYELAAQTHTLRILPMIDAVLAEAGIGLRDLDAIAFGRGPGSFTGLRIGFGTLQGLAFAADLPVLPVSTLMAMAENYYQNPEVGRLQPVLPALDARMNEVYWCLYQGLSAQGLPQPVVDEAVMAPEQVALLPEVLAQRTALTGIGAGWHYEALTDSANQVKLECYPRAGSIARIGAVYLANGQAQPIEAVQPVYLRNTVSWKKRQKIRKSSI
ncbi:MAG TPA: tRNA (adenosine(37)-N6)-threonylcarbamoyltransferase complex dimerization subunit type 1 TsaB [Cellvibrionaceae bacterium]